MSKKNESAIIQIMKKMKKIVVFVGITIVVFHMLLDIFDTVFFYKQPDLGRALKITITGITSNYSHYYCPHSTRVCFAGAPLELKVLIQNNTQETLYIPLLVVDEILPALYAKGFFRTIVAANTSGITIGDYHSLFKKEFIVPGGKEEVTVPLDLQYNRYFSWWPDRAGSSVEQSPGVYFIGMRCNNFSIVFKKGEKIITDSKFQGRIKSNTFLIVLKPTRSLRSYITFLISPVAQLVDTLFYDVVRLDYVIRTVSKNEWRGLCRCW